MEETIESIKLKLEMMKMEESERKDKIQRDKLNERIIVREAKEKVDANKLDSKNAKEIQEDAFSNMIVDFQKENPIHYDTNRNYWAFNWSTRCYEIVDDTAIMVKLTQLTGIQIIKGNEKFEFLELLRQTGRRNAPKELPAHYIQFKDKVVNIKTGKEFHADPSYLYVSPIPHNLGNSNKTPIIDKLFAEWVHPDHIITLYEIIAYCMFKQYPIAKEFFLIGEGRNGKSQYLKIISKFIGENNTVSTDLNDIANSRFEAVRLFKKSVAFVSETDSKTITKTSTLKALTGEDSIKGENKGKDGFDFTNYAKIIIASNELPETRDKTDGFYRRAFILDFPNKFTDTGTPIIDTIPPEEYENLGRKLIPILKGLLKRGTFTNDGSIEYKQTRFEGKSNPINSFINSSYLNDINSRIKMDDFQINFNKWRMFRKIPVMSNKKIFASIKDSGYEVKQMTERGSKIQYIIGLTYKPIEDDEFGLAQHLKEREESWKSHQNATNIHS
jgi:putative DNA primase/helicase